MKDFSHLSIGVGVETGQLEKGSPITHEIENHCDCVTEDQIVQLFESSSKAPYGITLVLVFTYTSPTHADEC